MKKLEVNGSIRFKCPVCHADAPLVEALAKDEVARGLLATTDVPGSKHSRILMLNDEKLMAVQQGNIVAAKELEGKQVKSLHIHYDFCGKCGTEYVRQIELKETTPQFKQVHRSGEKLIVPGFIPPSNMGKSN